MSINPTETPAPQEVRVEASDIPVEAAGKFYDYADSFSAKVGEVIVTKMSSWKIVRANLIRDGYIIGMVMYWTDGRQEFSSCNIH